MKASSDFEQTLLQFDSERVCLKPLKAQVGGHVYMKILNDRYVCKPLNKRELEFYQNIPKNLVEHIPCYRGTLVVGSEDSSVNPR